MSTKYLTNIDLNKNELQNAVVQNLAVSPEATGSKQGQLYFNTGSKTLQYFDDTNWIAIGAGAVKSVTAKTGETVIGVDNSDPDGTEPKLYLNIGATQGEGVTVSEASDGLKVEVQDATTALKGITILDDTPSNSVNNKAATPKGAYVTITKKVSPASVNNFAEFTVAQGGVNITQEIEVAKVTVAKATSPAATNFAEYTVQQGGADVTTSPKIEVAKVDVTKATTPVSEDNFAEYTISQGGTNITTTIDVAKITLTKQATAEEGYIATYVLAQGGTELGTKINIPKDYLVKSAEVKTCTEKDKPISGLNVGDKYIDFVINVKEGTATDEHIYLACKDIIKPYEAGDGITIDSSNVIAVGAGDGLTFDSSNPKKVLVDTGDGLAIDSTTKKVKVDAGTGIAIDSTTKKVKADIGDGLELNGNQVKVSVDDATITLDATSKKVKIKDTIIAQTTSAVYPVTIGANGLITAYGNAVKTAKKTSGTIASGATSVKVALTATQELLDCFVLDASGNKVVTDVLVANDGVTFSVVSTTEALTCFVVYQDTVQE